MKRLVTQNDIPISGVLECLYGVASIEGILDDTEEDGRPTIEYVGETEVNWDSQQPVLHNGERRFVDEHGYIHDESTLKTIDVPDDQITETKE